MADALLAKALPKAQPTKTKTQTIKTQRLILREARIYDLAAFHELYSNKEVMEYWDNPYDSISRTESYLKNMVSSPTNGVLAFCIVLPPSASTSSSSATPVATATDEGVVIGHAGIWQPQRNELVFMINHGYWKKGYMTEALAALVPIFWEKGLKKVFADVSPENEASLKVLKKCGFKQVGENIKESYAKINESLHMVLSNPDGGGEEGDGSGSSSGDNGGDKDLYE